MPSGGGPEEPIPYKFADPVTGEQAKLTSGDLTLDCAQAPAPLDDAVYIIKGGFISDERLVNATPCDDDAVPPVVDCQMYPNDKTDMQNDIALSNDYSVQLKDDGKPLYGWGGTHKRPNDVRMYARLALPDEWKAEGAPDFVVTKAHLYVDHLITNNPNDQIRPEDLENEAATGRKPSYRKVGEGESEVWTSLESCYEGDGDFIDGETPATELPEGTYLKNMPFALDRAAEPGTDLVDDPYAISSDLYGALTNAYYTTINRDPFEWSYVSTDAPDTGIYDFVGTPLPKTQEEMESEGLMLVSGPRWRLKPNKFGQDLPGLEIPLIECSQPPFQSGNIKYEVGERVTTVINLLDWDDSKGPSPLATSRGWVDVEANEFVTIAGEIDGIPYTSNGLPMTEDLDIAVYVKGDRKSTAIYSMKLVLEYEGEGPQPPPTETDMELTSLAVPSRTTLNSDEIVAVEIANNGPADDATGTVTVTGLSSRGEVVEFSEAFAVLASGDSMSFVFDWTAPSRPATFNWTATVVSDGDIDPSNNSATAITRVRR